MLPSKSGHAFGTILAPAGSGDILAKQKDSWHLSVRAFDCRVFLCVPVQCALQCFQNACSTETRSNEHALKNAAMRDIHTFSLAQMHAKGLRNADEYWKLHWFDMPDSRTILSQPMYFPHNSDLLASMTYAVARHMDDVCSTGRRNNNFCWLRNMLQDKIANSGYCSDAMPPETTFGNQSNHTLSRTGCTMLQSIFKQHAGKHLMAQASKAFCMQQVTIF